MRKFGLIGGSLSHSFSKKYFEEKFVKNQLINCEYNLYELSDIREFNQLIDSNNELFGLNVTIPFKESIIPFLDELDDEASAVGAVNTIKIERDNEGKVIKTVGFNTDVFGFAQSIKPFLKLGHERALIIGTGGASKAVYYLLEKKLGLKCLFVSRSPNAVNEIGYDKLNEYVFKFHGVIINTSPVGMYPQDDIKPDIPYEFLTENHLVIDLIYNPIKTNFLIESELRGAKIINGITMLHQQAEKAWEIWNRD